MAFFKKGLVELMLLNVFFIYNNYFFDTSNSVQNLPHLYILKIFFSTFQLDQMIHSAKISEDYIVH
jgi:uncharacterized membrane protein YqjE